MADKHPYMSGTAGLIQAINQLRKTFPAQVTADTLKKLSIAPNNETYVLNILRFIGVLDSDNKKNPNAVSVFNQHDLSDFQEALSELVRPAYVELFSLYEEESWGLPLNKLIGFFRNHDQTSEIVGKRQASTFMALGVLCGKVEESTRQPSTRVKKTDSPTVKPIKSKPPAKSQPASGPAPAVELPGPSTPRHKETQNAAGMALTVRVEINLPAGGDQETYDLIFKSIRENLLNGSNS